MRRIFSSLGVLAVLVGLPGCIVRVDERRPPPPAGYCAGWVWVQGHYGPYGRWHPGHWRCG
jgi:hypothetical protein